MRKTILYQFLLLIIFSLIIFTLTGCTFGGSYETAEHEINEEFANISIKTDTADIVLLPSDDGICRVTCYEEEKQKHTVEVQDGTLVIDTVNKKQWYDYIGINIDTPKITVYLPELEYSSLIIEESTGDVEIAKDIKFKSIDVSVSTGDVKCYASATEEIKISTSTGDVYVENAICDGDVTVDVSTGKISLTNIVCKNVISSGSTGDILLNNVIAAENFSVERSTGDIRLERSDAKEIFLKTSTGDIRGSLLTDKVFVTKTNTGSINVPDSVTGGRCEITTSTGDINISISDS